MNAVQTQEKIIQFGDMDSTTLLGYTQTLVLIRNAMSDHFGAIGLDNGVMRDTYGAFWVLCKLKLQFFRRPTWHETIRIRSWFSQPEAVRVEQHMELLAGSERLSAARLLLTNLCFATGRPLRNSALGFPPLDYPEEKAIGENFARTIACPEGALSHTHTVRYGDMDMSQHMDNVAYVRVLLDALPASFFAGREIAEMEVHYLRQSRENDGLLEARQDSGAVAAAMRIC